MGLYGTIVVEPADPAYWPAVDRQLTLTLDDLLVEDGHIAPFRRSGPTFTAMGRFGNVMLINGETEFSGEAAVGRGRAPVPGQHREHADLQLRRPRRARRSWSAATAAGTSARRSSTRCCSRRRSGRSSTCCSTRPGEVRLEHRTPDHVYDLGAFSVAGGAARRRPPRSFDDAAHRPRAHRRASVDRPRPRTTAGQGARVLLPMPLLYGERRHAGVRPTPARCTPRSPPPEPGTCPKCGMKLVPSGAGAGVLRLPDAPRGHRRRARRPARSAG